MKKCFVVCPIGKDGSDIRSNSDTVLEFIIEPVCKELEFSVTRVDKIFGVDRIDNTIYQHLSEADLVIADMSEHNPNAFYEIGYRHALNKPLIPIMKEGTTIPFDLASLRTITYANDLKKADNAKKRLKETIQSFDFSNEGNPPNSQHENQQINLISYLLKIQDGIDDLKAMLLDKKDEVASKAVELAVNQIQKNTYTPETKLMEIVFSQLFSNPQSLMDLAEVSQKLMNKPEE